MANRYSHSLRASSLGAQVAGREKEGELALEFLFHSNSSVAPRQLSCQIL